MTQAHSLAPWRAPSAPMRASRVRSATGCRCTSSRTRRWRSARRGCAGRLTLGARGDLDRVLEDERGAVRPRHGRARRARDVATLTTVEAAELVGVSVRTVQWWVERGYLAPCNRHPTRTMTWRRDTPRRTSSSALTTGVRARGTSGWTDSPSAWSGVTARSPVQSQLSPHAQNRRGVFSCPQPNDPGFVVG